VATGINHEDQFDLHKIYNWRTTVKPG